MDIQIITIETFKPGLLTALKNSAVAMTVERVVEDSVACIWFEGTTYKHAYVHYKSLIGAGTELVFRSGAFIRAQSN